MNPQHYAKLFGPALASQARDEGHGRVPDSLMLRAVATWHLPTAAYPLLRQEADRLLAADPRPIIVGPGSSWSYDD